MNLIKLILYLTEQVLLIIYNDKGSILSHIVYSFEPRIVCFDAKIVCFYPRIVCFDLKRSSALRKDRLLLLGSSALTHGSSAFGLDRLL